MRPPGFVPGLFPQACRTSAGSACRDAADWRAAPIESQRLCGTAAASIAADWKKMAIIQLAD